MQKGRPSYGVSRQYSDTTDEAREAGFPELGRAAGGSGKYSGIPTGGGGDQGGGGGSAGRALKQVGLGVHGGVHWRPQSRGGSQGHHGSL